MSRFVDAIALARRCRVKLRSVAARAVLPQDVSGDESGYAGHEEAVTALSFTNTEVHALASSGFRGP